MAFGSESKGILLPDHMTQPPRYISTQVTRMPTHCFFHLPGQHSRHVKCCLSEWLFCSVRRRAGAQEAISSSLSQRRDGWNDGDALNWAAGERRESGCPLVRERAPCLPALPLQSALVELFNRKTGASDFYQRAFLAAVSLVLQQPFGILAFRRLNGILEKNTVAQLHRQWVSTSPSKPKIAQRCTYQPMASSLFIYFPASPMRVDINCALFVETASDYTGNEAPL